MEEGRGGEGREGGGGGGGERGVEGECIHMSIHGRLRCPFILEVSVHRYHSSSPSIIMIRCNKG